MSGQLDLFGAAGSTLAIALPPTPGPQAIRIVPVAPSVEWERLLRRHPDLSTTVIITCSDLCQGEVIETLLLGPHRNYWLMRDRSIREMTGNQDRRGRHVFLTPRQGVALHARHRLIREAGGSHSCRYRLARPGEAAPDDLELPPATVGPEIA